MAKMGVEKTSKWLQKSVKTFKRGSYVSKNRFQCVKRPQNGPKMNVKHPQITTKWSIMDTT